MHLRTKIRLLLVMVAAVAGLGFVQGTAPASAVCGGGLPGEACYCPVGIKVGKFTIGEPVTC